jgi:hypothetical protein
VFKKRNGFSLGIPERKGRRIKLERNINRSKSEKNVEAKSGLTSFGLFT